MLFNSYEFLFFFLPLVFVGYYIFPKRGRSLFLTLASYFFYGWWDLRFCSLLLLSTIVDYIAGRRISASTKTNNRRMWLLISVLVNLSLLGFFKYFDLAARTINQLVVWSGFSNVPSLPMLSIILPVGISFYTFQSMSYSIDIYRGAAKPVKSFMDFACYVSLFPQLIAGPIVRYNELADQLVTREHTIEKIARGLTFFILGLAKKVIIADAVAQFVSITFNAKTQVGCICAWIGMLAYAMQIYFDFSGYSDMAVGLGYMFGFKFPRNFNSPYKAISITDFWRRWHISLSSWLRDYLYIPLGGNKKGVSRTFVNLLTTMLLGGLWHGANWTFVIWGGYHGVLLIFERINKKRGLFCWMPLPVQRMGTFILVMIGWVFFRSESISQMTSIFHSLLGGHGIGTIIMPLAMPESLIWGVLVVSCVVVWFMPNTFELKIKYNAVAGVLMVLIFILCVVVILINTSSPFLYFQF